MTEKTYTLKFHCDNCGTIFEVEIPFGEPITDNLFHRFTYTDTKGIARTVSCTYCGCNKVMKLI